MSFKSFLSKYAIELGKVGDALSSISSGIALPTSEKNVVSDTIETLQNAVTSILDGVDKIKDTSVKINKTDLDNAVKEFILDSEVFKAAVAEAVAAELAKGAPANETVG